MTGLITVNGEPRTLVPGSILDLLRAQAIDPARKGIAVAVNGAVLPRRDWPETPVKAGDEIEIVKPFAGG